MRFRYGDVIMLPDSTVRIMVVKPLFSRSSDAVGLVLVPERTGGSVLGMIWGHRGETTFLNTEHTDWRKAE